MTAASPTLDPTVQRGLLQGVANRWEATMEQVSALLGHDMLGLPLLYSLLQMSIGLVTSTAQAVQEDTLACIRLYRLMDILMYLTRVASLAVTAGWLYREAKETETILGTLDTTAWPARERHRVRHLLRLSRETKHFRVCGIVSLDHGLLFTIMGNTATFVVMLLQLPILTPGKAAEQLNQTEAKAAAAE
ncbi:uncharacterized protein LOC117641242 [Thrips palmi]|uniref:Uncharacterized protein LOC117641242 n=1 Tax=Thrips palmi TaxID=161013 RepID=A0A6P8ZIW0_THRPL|nr:uncharacterized protein LOC117641242 [Thrips palmi]